MNLKTILHPTDHTPVASQALNCAVALAHKYGARLLILHVVENLRLGNPPCREAILHGQTASSRQPPGYKVSTGNLQLAGVEVEYLVIEGDPPQAITQVAAEQHCNLIVLGSHDRGWFGRLLLGSVVEEVLRLAPCPVLVVKPSSQPAHCRSAPFPQEQIAAMHPDYLVEPKG